MLSNQDCFTSICYINILIVQCKFDSLDSLYKKLSIGMTDWSSTTFNITYIYKIYRKYQFALQWITVSNSQKRLLYRCFINLLIINQILALQWRIVEMVISS